MLDLTENRILITGAFGFLGKAVLQSLQNLGCRQATAYRSDDCDLRDSAAVTSMFASSRSQIVIHLAAKCGGIGANLAEPGRFFYDNMMIGLNVIEACRSFGVEKMVMVGTVCAYPENNDGLIHEDDLWNGYPEPTNAAYGIAKRALGEMLRAYHQQYGLKAAYPILANLYGPGDNFDPQTSHIIPAMIRRFTEAAESGAKSVTCWGTGTPTRDFLYVDDAADAIIRCAEQIEYPDPINIGTGQERSISHTAELIAGLCDYHGEIVWDSTKPDGQMRRVLDQTKMLNRLGWKPPTAFTDGLRATVEWWREHGHVGA